MESGSQSDGTPKVEGEAEGSPGQTQDRLNDQQGISEIATETAPVGCSRRERVPEIGSSKRWYDLMYRALNWMLSSWPRRLMPRRIKRLLGRLVNCLFSFHEFDRQKAKRRGDSMYNLVVPEGESISQGGIWVVDFFPPSYYPSLLKSLEKNGWDRDRSFRRREGTNAEMVTSARRGRGFSWARIGTVARPNSGYVLFDAKRESLPDEFELIQITAAQLGQGLTAVTAFIRLSDLGQETLNGTWTDRYEPKLRWHGIQRPSVHSRKDEASYATQLERLRLHELARSWLSRWCGGFFADTKTGQPVIDFGVFRKYDPTLPHEVDREMDDALCALGMDPQPFYRYISPQIPGAHLVPASGNTRESKSLKSSWGVIGSYDQLASLNERSGYGEKPYTARTLAGMLDGPIRAFLLHQAVLQYVVQVKEVYSDARDNARSKHRRFGAKQVEELRNQLLTTSLDLPVMARDSAVLWESGWRSWEGLEVNAQPRPEIRNPSGGFDVIDKFGEMRSRDFQDLLAEDSDYRDVLSTVASLGASAKSTTLGRRALIVAGASLAVSLVTLLVTMAVSKVDDEPIWAVVVSFFG